MTARYPLYIKPLYRYDKNKEKLPIKLVALSPDPENIYAQEHKRDNEESVRLILRELRTNGYPIIKFSTGIVLREIILYENDIYEVEENETGVYIKRIIQPARKVSTREPIAT
jgi:hypothetical protein